VRQVNRAVHDARSLRHGELKLRGFLVNQAFLAALFLRGVIFEPGLYFNSKKRKDKDYDYFLFVN